MNKLMISSLLITASLTMACSQPDDEAKKMAANTTTVEVGEGTMKADADNMVAGSDTTESTLYADSKQKLADATADAKEEIADAAAEAKAEIVEMVNDTKAVVKDAMDATEAAIENTMGTDKVAMAGAKAEMKEQPTESAATSAADLETGKTVYSQKCVACHGTGATGAPRLDDASWSERQAQGMDVLYGHAIKGYQGTKGYMPAKGGFMGLSDDEVKAAVDYMLSAKK